MGSTKVSNTTSSTQTTTPTPEESEMEKAQLQQFKDVQPGQTDYYKSAYSLANQLMQGGGLPGFFNQMAGGLSEQDIGTQASQYAARAMPGFQSSGLTDSGVAEKAIASGIAKDILLPSQEYNSNLLLNMLGLATGQGSNASNQFSGGTGQLASQLAGLRTVNSTGSSTQTSNPFLQSFYSSLGSGLGSVPGNIMSRFGQGSGMFGGGSI